MLIIGITGGSGSGKTTVLSKLMASFQPGSVSVLHMDCYYKDNSHLPTEARQHLNFDHPEAVDFDLLHRHVLQLKSGVAVNEPVYSFITSTRQKETVPVTPSPVVIVEGILIFTDPRLVDLFDIKVFVDTDADERVLRLLERDVKERGQTLQSVMERYMVVKKMHQLHIEPTRQLAHIIIPMNNENKVGIEILTALVRQKLETKGVEI